MIAITLAFREVPRTFMLLFLLLKKPSHLEFLKMAFTQLRVS